MHGMIAVAIAPPLLLPLLARAVHAGFPSPADDHAEGPVDLAALLVPRPASTFLVWVRGDSLSGLGVRDGDLAVVDRSLDPRPGDVVMVDVDGERAFKVWEVAPDGGVVLASANPRYPSVRVTEGAVVEVWGVMSGSARPRRHAQRA